MPWDQLCWLGHEHTLQCELFKTHECHNVLLVDRELNSAVLPHYEDDPVKLLWLLPITGKEFAYLQEHSIPFCA